MFVSKPSENDREEVLQRERSSCDKADEFIFHFIFPDNRRTEQDSVASVSTLICPREIAREGGDHLQTEGRVYVAQAIQKAILAWR